jgi:hypothetical protein
MAFPQFCLRLDVRRCALTVAIAGRAAIRATLSTPKADRPGLP